MDPRILAPLGMERGGQQPPPPYRHRRPVGQRLHHLAELLGGRRADEHGAGRCPPGPPRPGPARSCRAGAEGVAPHPDVHHAENRLPHVAEVLGEQDHAGAGAVGPPAGGAAAPSGRTPPAASRSPCFPRPEGCRLTPPDGWAGAPRRTPRPGGAAWPGAPRPRPAAPARLRAAVDPHSWRQFPRAASNASRRIPPISGPRAASTVHRLSPVISATSRPRARSPALTATATATTPASAHPRGRGAAASPRPAGSSVQGLGPRSSATRASRLRD